MNNIRYQKFIVKRLWTSMEMKKKIKKIKIKNKAPSSSSSSLSGLSLRAEGRGFSPATKRVAPGYFYWKIEEK